MENHLLHSVLPSIFRYNSADHQDVLSLSICILGNFSGHRKPSAGLLLSHIDTDSSGPARAFANLKPAVTVSTPTENNLRLARFEDVLDLRRRADLGDFEAVI
jgi:hypothetical protein